MRFMVQYNERNMSKKDLEEWALNCLDLDSSRHISAMDKLEAITAVHITDDASSAASAILDKLSARSGVVKGRLRISREEGVTIVRINEAYMVEDSELALIRKELHEKLNRHNLKILLGHETRSPLVEFGGRNALRFAALAATIRQQAGHMPAAAGDAGSSEDSSCDARNPYLH